MAEVERANNSKNSNKNKKTAFVFSDEEVEMLISEWGKRDVLINRNRLVKKNELAKKRPVEPVAKVQMMFGTNDFNSLHFLRDNITARKTISTISIRSSSTSPVPPDEDCNLDVIWFEAENSETTFGIDLVQQLDTAPMALSTPPSQAKRKRNAKEISVEDDQSSTVLFERAAAENPHAASISR
ncbi:Hypothetical predicted protein [Paramuricea clavata]|uniref:Uncharacterized protein n=1 Tax=Paramuricea clavata TaxID=317549 RepID=A0A7D9EG19_PARCT|nr:Hypothetical predicted protein [Paramuricea clavata]